jgi:hypothetical protein
VPAAVTIQSGQGTTSISTKFNAAAGNRTIQARGVNACGVGSNRSKTVVAVLCPRLGEPVQSNVFMLDAFPNPTSSLLNINFSTANAGDYRLMLTDLSGRIVKADEFDAQQGINNLQWNLEAYQSGVYLLVLQGQEGLSTLRIVIE